MLRILSIKPFCLALLLKVGMRVLRYGMAQFHCASYGHSYKPLVVRFLPFLIVAHIKKSILSTYILVKGNSVI